MTLSTADIAIYEPLARAANVSTPNDVWLAEHHATVLGVQYGDARHRAACSVAGWVDRDAARTYVRLSVSLHRARHQVAAAWWRVVRDGPSGDAYRKMRDATERVLRAERLRDRVTARASG